MMIHDIWLFCFFLLHLGSLSKIVPTTEETLIIEEPFTDAGFTFVNENDTPKDLTEDVKTSEQVYIFYSTVFSNGSNPVITTNISDSKVVRHLSNTLVQYAQQEYQEHVKQVSVHARDYQSARSGLKEGINREPKKETLEMKASKKVTLIYPSDVSRPSYSQRKDILENVIVDNIKQSD